jgi:hypothetical protein
MDPLFRYKWDKLEISVGACGAPVAVVVVLGTELLLLKPEFFAAVTGGRLITVLAAAAGVVGSALLRRCLSKGTLRNLIDAVINRSEQRQIGTQTDSDAFH